MGLQNSSQIGFMNNEHPFLSSFLPFPFLSLLVPIFLSSSSHLNRLKLEILVTPVPGLALLDIQVVIVDAFPEVEGDEEPDDATNQGPNDRGHSLS